MSNWLIYANIVVWLGLGLYLFSMARQQNKIQERLKALEHSDE